MNLKQTILFRVTLGIWKFFFLVLIYSLVSWFSFAFTSGGWTGVAYIVFIGPAVFGTLVLITFIASIVLRYRKKSKVVLPIFLLVLIIVVQVILLLLNRGDCGDNDGGYYFYERVLNSGLIRCHEKNVLVNSLWQYSSYLWILLLLIFLFLSFRRSK